MCPTSSSSQLQQLGSDGFHWVRVARVLGLPEPWLGPSTLLPGRRAIGYFCILVCSPTEDGDWFSQPGERVIARMLTSWVPVSFFFFFLENLPAQRAVGLSMCLRHCTSACCFLGDGGWLSGFPRVELAGWESRVPGAWKNPVFLARKSKHFFQEMLTG